MGIRISCLSGCSLEHCFCTLENWKTNIIQVQMSQVKSFCELISWWVIQSVNQSVIQSVNQSISQSVNQLISQSVNQSISQSVNQLIS